jgi:hypothetical protein
MFNGIWLVALEPLTIQGREVKAGERFHISRVHSGALLVQKRATILHPQPPPKNKAMVAEAPEPPPAPKRRGRQRKTDVAAEVTTEVKTGIAPTAPADPPPVPASPTEPSSLTITLGEWTVEPDAVTPELAPLEVTVEQGSDIPPRRYRRRDLEADE